MLKKFLKMIADNKVYLLFAIFSFISITLISQTSWLYLRSNWVDTNYYLTIAQGLDHGVLYKDWFEQKGPLLFLIHYLSYKISGGYFVVYVLQVIFLFLDCCLMFKIAHLWFKKGLSVLITLITIVFWLQPYYYVKGDSVEELVMPGLLYLLWVIMSSVAENKKTPEYTPKEWFLLGFIVGFILWQKYTLLFPLILFYLVCLVWLIMQHKFRQLKLGVIWSFCGFAILSGIVLIYHTLTKSLTDLWQTYFWTNMHSYSGARGLTATQKYIEVPLSYFKLHPIDLLSILLIIIASIIYLNLGKINIYSFSLVFSFVMGTLLSVFIGKPYSYYHQPLVILRFLAIIIIVGWIIKLLPEWNFRNGLILNINLVSLALSVIMYNNPTIFLENKYQTDTSAFSNKAIDYISRSGIKDPSILNYNVMDRGINNQLKLGPTLKYYTFWNLQTGNDEISNTQKSYLKEGIPKFVVAPVGNDVTRLNSKYHFIFWDKNYWYDGGKTQSLSLALYERKDN